MIFAKRRFLGYACLVICNIIEEAQRGLWWKFYSIKMIEQTNFTRSYVFLLDHMIEDRPYKWPCCIAAPFEIVSPLLEVSFTPYSFENMAQAPTPVINWVHVRRKVTPSSFLLEDTYDAEDGCFCLPCRSALYLEQYMQNSPEQLDFYHELLGLLKV